MKLNTHKKALLLMIVLGLIFTNVTFASTITAQCSDYYPSVNQQLWFYGSVTGASMYSCSWDIIGITGSGQYQYYSGYYTCPGLYMAKFVAYTSDGYMESDPIYIYVSN